jgi:hypothetical protein
MADNDEKELRQLNEDTFIAEARKAILGEDWDKFLWRVLADDFRIKRANPDFLPQDKHRMIAHIRYDDNPLQRKPSAVKVCLDGPYGVVTCVVTLGDEGKDQYHNLKVFARHASGKWQCVYWRVTKLTLP